MSPGPVKLFIALLCLAGLLGSSGAAMGVGSSERPSHYEGSFYAIDGSVTLTVKSNRAGRPQSGVFTARQFGIFCDRVATLYPKLRAHVQFHGQRYFEGDDYEILSNGGTISYDVEGKLDRRGRLARGSLLLLINPGDTVDGDCNSDGGRSGWRAVLRT